MSQLTHRNGLVRDYSARLRTLIADVSADPLDENKSVALVAHIVENRPAAAANMRVLSSANAGGH